MSRINKKDINTHVVWNADSREYEVISLETGEVVSSSGLRESVGKFLFSSEIALLICQEVRQGRTLSSIGNDPRFPPIEVISHWRRMHPLFEDNIKLARKDRAEGYHDKIIDMAHALSENGGIMSKEEIAAKKVAIDSFKWAAEKNNPEDFGKKQEISHSGNAIAPTIVVNTGINRNVKPDIIVQQNKVEETL